MHVQIEISFRFWIWSLCVPVNVKRQTGDGRKKSDDDSDLFPDDGLEALWEM